jgi:hypothetical protein
MKMKKGKEFENFVFAVEQSLSKGQYKVERNIHLNDANKSRRQIDVLITSELGRFKFQTAIECKDWKTKVDVPVIEGFILKLTSCSIEKGAIVSKLGFTPGAIEIAKKYFNIELYSFVDKSQYFAQKQMEIKIIQENLTYYCNEWFVTFKETKSINDEFSLYSKMFDPTTNKMSDITEITEADLLERYNEIFDTFQKFLKENPDTKKGYLMYGYTFHEPQVFRSNGEETYITRFRGNIQVSLNSEELKSKFMTYENCIENKSIATIVKLDQPINFSLKKPE